MEGVTMLKKMQMIVAVIMATLSFTPTHAAQHGIAMHGELKYKKGEHFDYADPEAPIGGELPSLNLLYNQFSTFAFLMITLLGSYTMITAKLAITLWATSSKT